MKCKYLFLVLLLASCGSDYSVQTEDLPTPLPPVEQVNEYGSPPDWAECFGGYYGLYFNIAYDHDYVETPEGEDPVASVDDPRALDFFDSDALAFERYESTLDMGPNWWPVDQGWTDDPAYFAARFIFWVRARERTTWELSLGAANDLWIIVDGNVAVAEAGVSSLEPHTVSIELSEGQFPVEVFFSHRRQLESALRVRPLPNDVVDVCYPDFD